MICYQSLYERLSDPQFKRWLDILPSQLDEFLYKSNNGNLPKWKDALENLPHIESNNAKLNQGTVSVNSLSAIDNRTQEQLKNNLKSLMPWRKGPFQLFDISIDTEWRSDWKWDRLIPHIDSLENKTVLDVGCGSGYHMWRMLGEGAKLTIGVDPSLLFVAQFQAIKKYVGEDQPAYVLPLKLEDIPKNLQSFDTVFSMGVLYHRKSPFDHLFHIQSLMKPGGELILETLVVEGDEHYALVPKDRYAMMNNVWFLPSPPTLHLWLERCGFSDVKLVSLNQTNTDEQRATEWMQFNSLSDFLNPDDANLTVENYPAPKRAIFVAKKPL